MGRLIRFKRNVAPVSGFTPNLLQKMHQPKTEKKKANNVIDQPLATRFYQQSTLTKTQSSINAREIALASTNWGDGQGSEHAKSSRKEPQELLTIQASEPKEREAAKAPLQLIFKEPEQGATQQRAGIRQQSVHMRRLETRDDRLNTRHILSRFKLIVLPQL